MMGAILLLISLAVGSSAAAASCEPTLFPQTPGVTFATVTVQKLPLFRDPEACSRSVGLCPGKAYLLKGDRVIAAQTQDSFRCVAFVGPSRQTTGWVRATDLSPTTVAVSGGWKGAWTRLVGDARLDISGPRDAYVASFEASGRGADPGNVRTGGAQGRLTVTGDRARLTDRGNPACRVDLMALGPYLIAHDGASDEANSACGGMGISLSGVYVRQRR